jgi:hypothetical protein
VSRLDTGIHIVLVPPRVDLRWRHPLQPRRADEQLACVCPERVGEYDSAALHTRESVSVNLCAGPHWPHCRTHHDGVPENPGSASVGAASLAR